MATGTARVTIHMVSSLDGFIAKEDESLSWLESSDNYENGVGEADAEEFLKTIDCFVLGSRTYELALKLGWPYGNVPTVVLTHRELATERKSVSFYSGDLTPLVSARLKPDYKNIWLVGGAMVAREFIRLKLADEIRLSIMPIILGGGTRFFESVGIEQRLHLKNVTAYKNGMVELWYEIKRD